MMEDKGNNKLIKNLKIAVFVIVAVIFLAFAFLGSGIFYKVVEEVVIEGNDQPIEL